MAVISGCPNGADRDAKADPAESPAGAITWKVMNFSTTEADGQGIGRGRILSAANGCSRRRKMGNVCEGDKYTGAADCLVVRLAAGTCYLRCTGALAASGFLRMGGNYPTGRRLKREAKRGELSFCFGHLLAFTAEEGFRFS